MQKLLLLSGLIGMIAVPVWASRERNPRKALKQVLLFTLVYNVAYLIALRVLYPHLN